MSHALQSETLALDDYLEGERDVDIRSEYIDGQVYAMAGASEVHNTIAAEFHTLINSHLPDECRVWQSDMKVVGEYQGKEFSYYPDIMASCEENTGDPYYRTNPCLIIEVLSPSTERIDLQEKFNSYTHIPSLLEYVIVSQDTPFLRLYRRRTHWKAESFYADEIVDLESINLQIQVKKIYRRVQREVGLVAR